MKLERLLVVALAFAFMSLTMTANAQSDKKEAAHAVGDKATDFELQGIGKKVKLSENFGDKGNPVVVVFSRANW